jgi:hypothetical protein
MWHSNCNFLRQIRQIEVPCAHRRKRRWD